jgi:hypothetical protein
MLALRVLLGIIEAQFIAETIIRLIAASGHPAAHENIPGVFEFIAGNFSDGVFGMVQEPGIGVVNYSYFFSNIR